MNKGLFYHLIISAVVVALWLLIVINRSIGDNAIVLLNVLLSVTNSTLAAFCYEAEFYNEKIKLW
jgi:hypothetical protein